MDAEQLHPHPGEGPVATADERRNIAGLHNVVNVLHVFLLVKKLPARKNELLHAFVRDDTLARMKGEPIAMWLVRFYEQLGELNRVGVDIVTALPDVAGRQGLNLAVLTEERIERVVSRLPDDTFPLDKFSAELDRVFASVHMSEPVSWTLLVVPGVPMIGTCCSICAAESSLGTIQTHFCSRKDPTSIRSCFVRTVRHV